MILNITLPELEAGEALKNISSKRLTDWKMAAMRKSPVRLKTPIHFQGKTYRAAILIGLEQKEKGFAIRFRPVWARCYRGCHARRSDIRILVVEFEDEKLAFDMESHAKAAFTTNGSGVGREAEEDAENFFALICDDDEGSPVIRQMLAYASTKYGGSKS
jgi:hypothetical protein